MGRNKILIEFDKVVRLIDEGCTQVQIAKKLGVGKNTMINYLKENSLTTKPRYKDLVKLRFGKLVVLERVENSKDRLRRYLCKCDCGNLIIVKAKYLNNGDTRSCGCYKNMENYKKNNYKEASKKIGEKYGRLEIIDIVLDEERGKYLMVCKCDCGSISLKCYTKMKQGKTVSCGCYGREIRSKLQSSTSSNKDRWYFIKCNEKVYCRSSYEVVYANYLMINNIDFEYESKCFKLGNGKRYTPDFYLLKEDKYIEIKGINYNKLDKSNQKEKFNLFANHYNIELYLWEDLVNICKLPYKNYSSYRYKANKLNVEIEAYFANMLYI